MPISFAKPKTQYVVERIKGAEAAQKRLEDLGFRAGEKVEVVQTIDGNLICRVGGAKVAIDSSLAAKIEVAEFVS